MRHDRLQSARSRRSPRSSDFLKTGHSRFVAVGVSPGLNGPRSLCLEPGQPADGIGNGQPGDIARLFLLQLRHRSCGVANYVEHDFGLGEHGDMAGGNLHGLSTHALRGEAFQIGMNGAVLGGHNGPTRL